MYFTNRKKPRHNLKDDNSPCSSKFRYKGSLYTKKSSFSNFFFNRTLISCQTGTLSMIARHVKSMYFLAEGQEIKDRQSSLGNISQMWEIITPGGRRTRLREIPEFSIKLREAPAECGRVDSSVSWVSE